MPIANPNTYQTVVYNTQTEYETDLERMNNLGWILICFVMNPTTNVITATYRQKQLVAL